MNSHSQKSVIVTTGLAMFSMFFGAGNVVFPLAIGQITRDMNLYGILGLLLTGVGVPFIGLASMTLFNGNYNHFFARIGKVPGFVIAVIIMGLIGPFGATPRLLTVSYGTLDMYWSGINPMLFNVIACTIIFLFTFRKSSILDVLGKFLTPCLLAALVIIIVKGIWAAPAIVPSDMSAWDSFSFGIEEGYFTMDLLGAVFFSSVVLSCLEGSDTQKDETEGANARDIIMITLKSSVIGATLLAITYVGFSYVAAYMSTSLLGISTDRTLGALALEILGPYAGIVAIAAVSLACLTTAIALAAVFSEFLHYDIFQEKIGYLPCLITTLVATFFVSTLGFDGIASFLSPILIVLYPALIVLCFMNLLYKLRGTKMVLTPVIVTFVASLIWRYWL